MSSGQQHRGIQPWLFSTKLPTLWLLQLSPDQVHADQTASKSRLDTPMAVLFTGPARKQGDFRENFQHEHQMAGVPGNLLFSSTQPRLIATNMIRAPM